MFGAGAVTLAACGAPNPSAEAPTDAAPQAAATSGAPAATAPAVAGGVKLVLMAGTRDVSEDEIKAFMAANPSITIERIDEDATRLKAMMTAGNPPDLIRLGAPQVPILVIQDAVLELTEYFKAGETLKIDDLAPPIAYFKFDGTRVGEGPIYGMHKDWSPDLSLFASLAAFEEAGLPPPDSSKAMTYAELAELAPQLTKRAGDRIERVGYHIEHDWIDGYIQRRLLEDGESVYAADHAGAAIKDNPKVVEFFQYVYDLSKENLIWNPLNPSPSGWNGDDFLKGQVGLVNYGYWFSGSIRAAEDSPVEGNIVMLPGATWSGKRANPSIGGAGMVITRGSKNPDAAWAFFEYFMGGEPAQNRAKSGWGVPALKSLYPLMPQETEFDKQTYAVLQDELTYAENAVDINPFMDSAVWAKSWKSNLEQALRGSITFEQAIENLDTDVNQAIADGRSAAGL
jgi:multiple sugar transport system substrate-binding protein